MVNLHFSISVILEFYFSQVYTLVAAIRRSPNICILLFCAMFFFPYDICTNKEILLEPYTTAIQAKWVKRSWLLRRDSHHLVFLALLGVYQSTHQYHF